MTRARLRKHYTRERERIQAKARAARDANDTREVDRLATRMFSLLLCAAVDGVRLKDGDPA